MKKLNILLSALILTSSIPLYAAFCIKCGKNLPNEANFCPNCGTAASEAFQAAEPESQTSISNISSKDTTSEDNLSLADYHFINKIEESLTQTTSNVALRQCQELKRQNSANMQRLEDNYMNYSIYRRKIHDLHMSKLKALEDYIEARREVDRNSNVARSKALMSKELFILDKLNDAIDTLLTGGNTLSNINKVEDIEKRIKKTTANYIVTSSYLTLGNVRVRRNEPIWIEDISGASARVHHMGDSLSDEPAVGNVSIFDLEKRTNWTSDSDFFYSTPKGSTVVLTQPSRPEPTVNVVVWDGIYPYRRWRHFPDWGPPFPPHRPKPAPPHRPKPAPPMGGNRTNNPPAPHRR